MPHTVGRSWSLYCRNTRGTRIWYVRTRKPDGSWSSGRSTGCVSREDAERWVERELIDRGMVGPAPRRSIAFDQFAADFWNPDGRYVKTRRAHGHSLGATYVRNQQRVVEVYLLPTFGSRPIAEITGPEIDDWLVDLYHNGRTITVWDRASRSHVAKQRPLSGSTVNNVRKCLIHIMTEAHRRGHVESFAARLTVRGRLVHHLTAHGISWVSDSARRGIRVL